MSEAPPTPPAALPAEWVDRLNDCTPDRLRQVSEYADELAEHKARAARLATDDEERGPEERPEELPEDVPTKATTTIKEINDNRYYYWQWREGDEVKSQYKGPVDPSE